MTSWQEAAAFQEALGLLADDAMAKARQLASAVTGLPQQDALAVMTEAFPEIVTPHVAASGDLTATWYEAQVPDSGLRVAAELPDAEALAANGRWAVLQDDPAKELANIAERRVIEASRDTVTANAARDGLRYARQARPDACGICRMLALGGARYVTQDKAISALMKGHRDNCRCILVPDWPGHRYRMPPYAEQWKRDYKAARAEGLTKPGSIANAMDYAAGGRRNVGGDAQAAPRKPRSEQAVPRSRKPVNLDRPRKESAPVRTESDAKRATRLLPGMEESLKHLLDSGMSEDSPQVQWHRQQIARLRAQLSSAH